MAPRGAGSVLGLHEYIACLPQALIFLCAMFLKHDCLHEYKLDYIRKKDEKFIGAVREKVTPSEL